jgi:hypothetical protein
MISGSIIQKHHHNTFNYIINSLFDFFVFFFGFIVCYINPSDPKLLEEIKKKKLCETKNIKYNLVISRSFDFCIICVSNIKESSKHCKTCDRCVLKFDHHCNWLNNCIGEKNYKYFFTLLIVALANLVAKIYFFVYVIKNYFDNMNINNAKNDLYGNTFNISNITNTNNTLNNNNTNYSTNENKEKISFISLNCLVISFIFCIIDIFVSLNILYLIIIHIYVRSKGLTTYEFIIKYLDEDNKDSSKRKNELENDIFNNSNNSNLNNNNINNNNNIKEESKVKEIDKSEEIGIKMYEKRRGIGINIDRNEIKNKANNIDIDNDNNNKDNDIDDININNNNHIENIKHKNTINNIIDKKSNFKEKGKRNSKIKTKGRNKFEPENLIERIQQIEKSKELTINYQPDKIVIYEKDFKELIFKPIIDDIYNNNKDSKENIIDIKNNDSQNEKIKLNMNMNKNKNMDMEMDKVTVINKETIIDRNNNINMNINFKTKKTNENLINDTSYNIDNTKNK